ncbi:MAG: CoA-binding protein, partial [Granulosicoccaceae bacterium]
MKLDRLLRPRSIAVFGGAWGRNVIEQCQRAGFSGDLWPVHPTAEKIGGLTCYRSVAELPGAPDASFIGVNRHISIEVVEQLAARGAGGAVCFASGFAEAAAEDKQAAQLQEQLLAAAGDMPILGPNCYGLINYLDGALLWPDQHGGEPCDSGVAIITQSSNILLNLTMQRRALPLAYALTAGNQAQQGLASMASALLDDERVTAIGLHIEGFGDLQALHALAVKAHAKRVPIIALKMGR